MIRKGEIHQQAAGGLLGNHDRLEVWHLIVQRWGSGKFWFVDPVREAWWLVS